MSRTIGTRTHISAINAFIDNLTFIFSEIYAIIIGNSDIQKGKEALNMKKAVSIFAVILICTLMLPYLSLLPVSAADGGEAAVRGVSSSAANGSLPGSISSCVYDAKTGRVRIKGSLSTAAVRDHADSTIAIFALDVGEEVGDIEKGKLIPALSGISMTTLISVDITPPSSELFGARSARYVLALETKGGVFVRVSEPAVPTAATGKLSCGFKGIESVRLASAMNAEAGTVIVEVNTDRVISGGSGGYLYTAYGKTVRISKEYLAEIDDRVKILTGAGADVLIRLVRRGKSKPYIVNAVTDTDGSFDAYVCAAFIASRYSGGEYGKICGFVAGKRVNDITGVNDTGDLTEAEYVKAYYEYIRSLASAIDDTGSDCALIVPVSSDWTLTDRGICAEDFLTAVAEQAHLYGSPDFCVMVESEHNPCGMNNDITEKVDGANDSGTTEDTLPAAADTSGSSEPSRSEIPEAAPTNGEEDSPDTSADASLPAGTEDADLGSMLKPADQKSGYISTENLSVATAFLISLSRKYGHISESLIYLWEPDRETVGNALSASYVYNYYRLYAQKENVASFIVSFSEKENAGETYAANELIHRIRYIDVKSADEYVRADDVLKYFGLFDWREVISDEDRVRLASKVIGGGEFLRNQPSGVKGTYIYFDFRSTVGLNGWYAGTGCSSIALDRDEYGRALVAGFNGEGEALGEYCFAAYGYKYEESFRYTDYIAVEFSVGDRESGEKEYEILLKLGGDGFTSEYKGGGFVAGKKYTVYIDVSSMTSDNVVKYLRIGAKGIAGKEHEYSLNIYSVKALSTKYSNTELSDKIAEERERIMNEDTDSGVDMRAVVLVIAVLMLTAAVIILTTVQGRRKKENGNGN